METPFYLPFWSFFHDLERQLSYERWIDKYKLFLEQLYSSDYLDNGPEDYAKLSQLCKTLYLQDIKDEKRFENMLSKAWEKEKIYWQQTICEKRLDARPEQKEDEPAPPPPAPEEAIPKKNPEAQKKQGQEPKQKEMERQSPPGEEATKEYYYTPPPIPQTSMNKMTPNKEAQDGGKHIFNLQDEYFPTTRREMNKAWQYLRHEDKGDYTTRINIPATVEKLARETIFTDPVFIRGKRNREDTLLIFADVNGSMVPFHELTRRLIGSAKEFGGHKYAAVYYFQNYPLGYLYQTANLTKPRKIAEAFITANRQITTAVIVSDAGFAREYGSDRKYETRLKNLDPFFKLLSGHCARTLWLNPMPEHRWHKPTAMAIQGKILRMAPVLENGMNTLQNIMRTLGKENSVI